MKEKGFWENIRFRLRSYITPAKRAAAEEMVKDALSRTEHGLELQYLDGPEADITSKLAIATSQIISSLREEDSAAVRLGQLLIVKTTIGGKSNLKITTLSPQQRRELDSQPQLMKDPKRLMTLVEEEDPAL